MDSLAILNRIEEKRIALGITKTDLYRNCHITASAFSQWKTGKTKLSPKSISRIAAYLNTTYEYLITGIEKPAAQGDGLDEDRAIWSDAWDKASPQQRALALAALRLEVPQSGD